MRDIGEIKMSKLEHFISFNNRELSIIFWLIIFFSWAMTHSYIRKSSVRLIKTFFGKKLLFLNMLFTSYVVLVVVFLSYFDIWNIRNIKETVYWIIGVGFVMFLNVSDVTKKEKFFRNVIVNSTKFIIVLEFLVNYYVFSIWTELLIIPFLTIITLTAEVAGMKIENYKVKKFLENVLSLIGILLLIHILYRLISNYNEIAKLNNLIDLLLPVVLTILYLPFLYYIALWFQYEEIISLLKFQNKQYSFFMTWQIFKSFKFNLFRLNEYNVLLKNIRFNTREEFIEKIAIIKTANDIDNFDFRLIR